MNKRIIYIIALLCAFGQEAWAQTQEPVQYVYRSWDGSEVVSETRTESNYTVLSGNHSGEELTLNAGVYYVVSDSDVKYRRLIAPYGTTPAYLILCDGAKLTAQITIEVDATGVNGTQSLTIFGQTNGSGKLEANAFSHVIENVEYYTAGIGSSGKNDMGTLVIHGGNISASSSNTEYSAGMGGGGSASYDFIRKSNGGIVTIYGGTVSATAGQGGGAGIGGGVDIVSHGGYTYGGKGGILTVYGGSVTASANAYQGGGAGIGGAKDGSGGSVFVYGGNVYAQGGVAAAGIGSGNRTHEDKDGGTLTVYGGRVEAHGGVCGAGIGGGQNANGAQVTVNGGVVSAYGGTSAAGIGSGDETLLGPNINGGSLTVNGGTVFADGTGWGAGIGGGEDADGATVVINGGSVTAWAGADAGNKNGCAIGSEEGDNHRGSLQIGDAMMVHAGQNPTDANSHLFPKETRGAACFFRPYARIEPCDHPSGVTYTVSGSDIGDKHTMHCKHCKLTTTEPHNFNGTTCTVCHVNTDGIKALSIYLPVINEDGSYTNGNYGEPITYYLPKGSEYVLPSAPLANEPLGMKFAGWRNGSPAGNTFIAGANEGLLAGDWIYNINDNITLTARYHKVTLFNTSGNWNETANWYWHEIPGANDTIIIAAEAIIPSGYTALGGDRISLDLTGTITIKDGGQFINDVGVWATVEKSIAGHSSNAENGWHFISQPTMDFIKPSLSNGFLTEDSTKYDLYYYEEPTHRWRNYKQGANSLHSHFSIEPDKGYLYANEEGTTLVMSGTVRPSTEPFTINNLSLSEGDLAGFNLVGNPFACNAIIDRPAYVISGRNVVAYSGETKVVAPCEGVMVQADAAHTSVTFTPTTELQSSQPANRSLQVVLSQPETNTRGMEQIDNAIISFKEGERLEKFIFNADMAKLYIPQGGKDYAITNAERQGEMPLNFEAKENGSYTISVNPENVEMNYLHLIDNLTGADVDLLVPEVPEPVEGVEGPASYTFQAKTTDYASRFKLVFSAKDASTGSASDGAFAFISNGQIIITNGPSTGSGTYTLQVVDVMGRIIVSTDVARNVSTAGMTPGMYVLRLINGNDVKTQKIVVR